jgi:hypothetical protein
LNDTFTGEFRAAQKILQEQKFAPHIDPLLKEIAQLMKEPNPGPALDAKLDDLRRVFIDWDAERIGWGQDPNERERWAPGQIDRYFDPNYNRDRISPDAIIEACWPDADYRNGSIQQDNTALARKAAAIKFLLGLNRYNAGPEGSGFWPYNPPDRLRRFLSASAGKMGKNPVLIRNRLRNLEGEPYFTPADIAPAFKEARQCVAVAAKLDKPDERTQSIAGKWFICQQTSGIFDADRQGVIDWLRSHFKLVSETLKSSDFIFSGHPSTRYLTKSVPLATAMETIETLKTGEKDDMNVIYLAGKSAMEPATLISKILNQMMHLNPQVGDFRYGWLAPGPEFPTGKAIRNAESLQNFASDLMREMPGEESRVVLHH